MKLRHAKTEIGVVKDHHSRSDGEVLLNLPVFFQRLSGQSIGLFLGKRFFDDAGAARARTFGERESIHI